MHKIVQEMRDCDDLASLGALIRQAGALVGLPNPSVIQDVCAKVINAEVLEACGWSRERIENWNVNQAQADHRDLRRSMETRLPFASLVFDQDSGLSKDELRRVAAYDVIDLRSILFVPVHHPSAGTSAVTWCSPEKGSAMRCLATNTHLALMGVSIQFIESAEKMMLRARKPRLSGREMDCIRLVSAGLSTKEISRALSISPHTVGEYVRSAARKVGAKSRAHLVRNATLLTRSSILE